MNQYFLAIIKIFLLKCRIYSSGVAMKRLCLGLLLACRVFAEDCCCYDCPAVRETNVLGCIQGKLASPRKTENGVFFTTDFLYWLPQQEGLEYAFSQASPAVSTIGNANPADFATIQHGKFNRVDF